MDRYFIQQAGVATLSPTLMSAVLKQNHFRDHSRMNPGSRGSYVLDRQHRVCPAECKRIGKGNSQRSSSATGTWHVV
jgi:hypothetical protein